MTRLVARLVLAMLALPLAGGVFVLLAILLFSGSGPTIATVTGLWTAIYAFVALYWISVWRDAIAWNGQRKRLTVVWGVLSISVSALASLFLWAAVVHDEVVGMMIGGGLAPIIWVLATVLIWRESPQERIERVSRIGKETILCPFCGYNMTGLTQTRCPECGGQFTIDQLVASQPKRDATELSE